MQGVRYTGKKMATRDAYGQALARLGSRRPDLVVLDADLAGATKTSCFRDVYPERHIDCGIAEGNMVSIAAGLASTGMTPVASTFAMFAAGRAFEQIRNSIGYPHLNVKICATHGGISVGEDGATHQCLEDFALMRTIPGMVVMCPADETETHECLEAALDHQGPVYIRFGRSAVPVMERSETPFQIGKGRILRKGKDVSILANGLEVNEAVHAAQMLKEEGIDAEVIDLCTIKPLDEELVLSTAEKTGLVITVEEHSVIGGLGGAVAELLAEKRPTRLVRIGMQDRYGESGPAPELLHKYRLDAEGIFHRTMEAFRGA